MKTQLMNKVISLSLCVMMALLTVLARPALAQHSESWTTAATAGTVDEEDKDKVDLGGGVIHLNTGGGANSEAFIRYNLVATDGLFVSQGVPKMRVRFRDGGSDAQVIVSLWRLNMGNGSQVKMLELNSNDFAPSNGFQTQSTAPCAAKNYSFDFSQYAYYVQVKLVRSSSNGQAGLASIQVYTEPHPGCHG